MVICNTPLAVTTKEFYMYARRVSMKLKPNSTVEFTQRLEKEVIPMLRKQSGFRDEITFVAAGGTEAFGVSLWDTKQSADNYNLGGYAAVTKILEKFIDGTPKLETFEVANSTFHKIAASATA
jgi:heme-degrading monooxygenase HmoA